MLHCGSLAFCHLAVIDTRTVLSLAVFALQVYEYAVNTILLSFCEDCEEHDGNAQFAPPLLIHALGQAQAHHDAEVAKANKGAVPLDTAPSSQFITS